jgi:uncharacterized protein YaiI (UPF0178 family)
MRLFIDGDAFPNLLKPIVQKQIKRLAIPTYVISNKKISVGDADTITYIIVQQGADEADHKIVEMVEEGDLVITADIPLADRVIDKGAHAIDHRGERYTAENIKQYLAMRNLMDEIRSTGEITGGPKPFGTKDAHAFANQLNAFLAKYPAGV